MSNTPCVPGATLPPLRREGTDRMPAKSLSTLRVDQVGSLLRPAKLKGVFARYLKGQAREDELRQTPDEAVREVIATQEAHGLPIITDGEFRRLDFPATS